MYVSIIKPTLDFIISLLILLIISPILIVITFMLYFANEGKPFYFQKRPGKDEKIFNIIKFRTMNDKMDASGNLLPDKDRITAIGGIIRDLSLDEIPQLLNVIIGQMSLVGPRPLLVSYLPLYNDFQKRRHNVKPGITGWAQVNGRNAVSWNERFEHDIWYVDNISFLLDLKILWLTIVKVIRRDGARPDEGVTMDFFHGNKN